MLLSCPNCGGRLLKIDALGSLCKCMVCGVYLRGGGKLYKHKSIDLVGVISEEVKSPPTVTLTPDQWTFVFRVAERLTPIDGYTPEVRKRMLVRREELRKSLEKVFTGEQEMTTWFNQTGIDFNLQDYELVQILYESLEGLESKEVKELKEQLKGVYAQLVRMRTIGPTG